MEHINPITRSANTTQRRERTTTGIETDGMRSPQDAAVDLGLVLANEGRDQLQIEAQRG